MTLRIILSCVTFVLFGLILFVGGDVESKGQRNPSPNTIQGAPAHELSPPTPIETSSFVSPQATTPPTGSVTLVFHKSSDKTPVHGLRAGVLRDGDKALTEVQTSDAQGTLTWTLPAGVKYRWYNDSGRDVAMVPRHENQERLDMRADGGQRVSGEMPPPNLSGSFAITAGTTVKFIVSVYDGTITGTLPVAGVPHLVDLFFDNLGQLGGTLSSEDCVRAAQANDSGRFTFSDLSPGKYTVGAWWRQAQDYYFARQEIHLSEGEYRELGCLVPFSGPPTTFAFPIKRGDETVVLPPSLAPLTAKILLVPLDHLPADLNANPFLDVEIGTGQDLYVHGLAGGRWTIQQAHEPRWPSNLSKPYPPRDPVSFTAGGRVEFPYIMEAPPKVEQPAVVLPQANLSMVVKGRPHLHYFLVGQEGRIVDRGQIYGHNYDEKDGVVLQFTRSIPAGSRLLVTTQRNTEGTKVPNLCAYETVSAQNISVSLQPGASVSGIVTDPQGTPCRSTVLYFRPVCLKDWVYATKTDNDGRFSMSGLLPHIEIEGMFVSERFSTRSDLQGLQLIYSRR